MELKDLRVGNYYHWNAEGKDYLFQVEPKDFVRQDYKNFEPVPLTEDWLIKFGFKWKNFAMRLGDFCIRKQINGWMLYISNENYNKTIHLEFVHILQNTYFYIEEKELIFKD